MKKILPLSTLIAFALCFCGFFSAKANVSRFATTGPLPVILVGFTAIPNSDQSVNIKWSTQQETNSARFVIERSADASTWYPAGSMPAKGFSEQVSNYVFTDESSLDGITYYRLRIEDRDGDYGYTGIEIARVSLVKKIVLFPNPAKDVVRIYTRQSAPVILSVRLVGLNGQVLQEKKINAGKGETISLPVQMYAPGIYLVQITEPDGNTQTSKVFISR